MSKREFVTAINCMDGRVQLPVIHWMQEKYDAEYVDMITEAGPTRYLLEGSPDNLEAMQAKVGISCEKHGSDIIAVVGHHDCAGNPVPREEKVNQIKQSVELVQSWGYQAEVIGLYVNDQWEVEFIL
ncbi:MULTISPECIES: carbonic anhydrase [Halobacillus]|uniref:Carbonic anhydrase n=1 Tax=Halobacillus halophilus (strain ATCC 35676 / DSM 2266 / JCM 20832 / KCTC 3685 / LMG 17431 / NBRC 102448 / NCIMB 2269) TaxID=866895 RepID=I0JHF9_HALH3|nr:carbonic anhydrase [Halobacillus halophilus]ASF37800.1 hypothetical protein CEH05_01160 [Halobacillus halophilus]CCG43577.1 hypothetical protein HBHAL_1198 [Halobacillus halophilus DSM 2266]